MSSPTPSRQPRERLASIKNGGGRPSRRPPRQKTSKCPYCQGTNIMSGEDGTVCGDCGSSLNDSNIVAEVTFGESAAGAAVVQGGIVRENARHANTLGPAFRRAGGGMESREVTENQGRDEIRRQSNGLNLPESLADQAFSIYKLAASANFIQGRRVNIVASVCLYVACRRDKNNQTLLMDFSETISVNVFKLGQTYQDLKKALVLPDNNPLGVKPVIDVENLILKFARKLEFGSSLYKVAEDAARIMRRMKRDWMVTGRRPSGLCGACIILAARMNNFRRTVREVVYVVKVADVTVAKRLEEFQNTKSSDLTVDQFVEYSDKLKWQHDPPALYNAKAREERLRRLEQGIPEEDDTTEETPAVPATPAAPARTASAQAKSQPPRRDKDGFAIPAIPVDPSLLGADAQLPTDNLDADTATEAPADGTEPPRKKRKYTKRSTKPLKDAHKPVPEISEDDLAIEADLEDEMEQILNDPASVLSPDTPEFNESETRARSLADALRNPNDATITTTVPDDPEIGADEFEDDPEVRNCLLSEEERKIKERIWVTHNEDWLRAQQAKILKKALDEANGTSNKVKRKRKKGRMGDGSLLEGTPVEDAADATQRMLEKRANRFSKHIDYEKLNKLYAGIRGSSSNGTATNTESEVGDGRDGSPDSVQAPPTPEATQPAAAAEDEEDPEEAIKRAALQMTSVAGADDVGDDDEEEDEENDMWYNKEEEEAVEEDADPEFDDMGGVAGYDEDEYGPE